MSHKVIIIPARYQSSRFPGKPLVKVAGISMIERVWSIAKKVQSVDEVYVATDDIRISQTAEAFGAKVIMTPAELRNGTERAHYAANTLDQRPDIIINLQGDAVLTPPWILDDLIIEIDRTKNFEMGTVAVRLNLDEVKDIVAEKAAGELAGVLVVFDCNHNALYFSRSLIPRRRDHDFNNWEIYKHIGIYAYSYETLERYVQLDPTALEEAEQLEQLRALECGINLKVAISDYRGRSAGSIDTPEDLIKVEALIKQEGELL